MGSLRKLAAMIEHVHAEGALAEAGHMRRDDAPPLGEPSQEIGADMADATPDGVQG